MKHSLIQQTRSAIAELLDSKMVTETYLTQMGRSAELSEHPFRLERNLPRVGSHTIYLLAEPGATDASVDAMKAMLAHQLSRYNPFEDGRKFRLRIIKVPVAVDPVRGALNMLYFELVSYYGTFICGGCTDHTGTGGRGGRTLEGIFNMISLVYDIPIEEVVSTRTQDEVIEELHKALAEAQPA
jgi:hypothetical protein